MADPAKTPLGKMLLDEINPVVMVLDTPLVEETCRKNGLSFVEMLSPFCVFNNIDVPVRTASDQPYRLQKFRLRLFYASDIRQPNLEVARERLKQVITQAGENGDSELCSDPPPIENLDARFESENLPSWFAFFNKELVRSASFSDHEAFDHPVACLLVVSSKDEQPINQFVDLFNTNKLPSLLNDGAMDPKILNYYLLVHDNQDGTTDKATKILTEMRSTFGSDCQLLCINSSEDGPVEHQDNPWVRYKSETSSGQNLGSFLNVNDINEMRDIMQELSTKQIIPCMEQKIRVLNQQVSATRKGFKNQIKSLWWRKGKDEIADSSNGSMYTFSSVESQIRVLGDYAFMLRDYELALSNYRLISTDYKLDKAWKRYAGVQEMMGLSYFLLDQSRKEAEYCLENAFTTYLKIGPSGQQNATRCGLWWVEMLKTRYQFREAASVYFRICGEEPLHSAVMLEQASYCYLLSTPPMLHKYGFHLVLSGERYKKSDQIKHAIRTYKNAISVYKEATWSHIKDHIYFNIGQWYAYLGRYDLAVSHVLEVLACSHQSKTSQDIFLRQFLQIVQKTGRIFEVPKLQLPEIKISSLRVIFEDHRTYATPAVASVKESIWRSLEEDLIPSLSTGRTNWLELHSKLVAKTYKESNVCVAGEAVRVDFEIKNPLQIPISVSSVSLICELAASSDETQTDANSQAGKLQNDNELTMTTSRESDNNSFLTLSKVDFSLGGGEVVMVQLTVTPRIEGILQIVGVRWNLSSAVVGFHNFESNPRRKKSAKGRQRGNRSLSDNLKFVVIKSLPKLEGFIQPLPTSTYAGDVRHLVLELRNQSECTVKNLKLKVSHPRFLNVGSQESLDADFPACLEKRTEHHYVQPDHNNISQPVFIFPEDTIITAETPLLWPLWFRAAVPGNISLYLTIYYEIEDSSSSMRYRTLRMHHNVQVLPSLGISFQVSPCPSKLEEFLVQMDVVNRTSTKSFQVHQLASVGEQWEISLLEPVDTILPSQCLVAGQSLSCFFMLKNQRKSGISENKTSSTSVPLGSVVRLGPEGSTEPLFDTSSSPLVDFHRNERLHQEISHQGDSTVDFILISRSLKSDLDSGTSDPPQLFSHHSCHCSIESRSPISWLVDGPRTMYHNFSESFCEIKLSMTIYNSSNAIASVHINTLDSSGNSSDATSDQSATSSSNQVGWHDVSLVTDIKVTSDVLGARFGKPPTLDSVSPFIWSASSSTRVLIEPMTAVEIPLKICVFSPGTYDLSNYLLHWNLVPPNGKQNLDEGIRQSSGTCQGYLYYLTVLQSA